ncbi:MAG: teichuronic acid exporter [Salibacteraceae bacterium]
MANTIKSGLFWSAIDTVGVQLVTFAIGIVLARLLSPSEFGIIGMVTVFIAVSNVFVSSGFSDALMRRETLNNSDLNTVFWFNLGMSILLYFVLFFSSEMIANYFSTPSLNVIVKVLALGLVFNGLVLVQNVIITKAMNFKLLAKVSIFASIGSGIFAIVLAYQDYGVWALVFKTLLAQVITLICIWWISKWAPKMEFSISSFRKLFGFGSRLLVLGIINTLYNNIYYLIIGKIYAPAELGLYTRAESLKNLPSKTITGIVQKVSYPALAKIQSDKVLLRTTYVKLIKNTMFIALFGMLLLASMAKPFVELLMGTEWSGAGVYLEILCFTGFFIPLDALNTNILKIMNRSDLILKVGVWRKLIGVPVIVTAIYWGILPMLYLLVIHRFLSFLLISNYSKAFIGYGTFDQLKDISPFLIMNLVLFVCVKAISSIWLVNNFIHINISILVFVIGWIVVIKCFKINLIELFKF